MGVPSQGRGPLSERYRPRTLDEVVGGAKCKAELRAWADRWASGTPPARRAVVLAGPPGVGKTTTALALAEDYGWTLVEMNASDARNEAAIEQVAGRASITHTLTDRVSPKGRSRALILLDEADCLTGRLTETARSAPAPVSLRGFLQGRYGTTTALNTAWGLVAGGRPAPFKEWEDVPRSAGRAAWTRLAPAQRDLGDWKGGSRPRDLSDRGGLAAIARLVKETRQPLVLTVNDEKTLTRYSAVFRTGVVRVHFYPLRDPEMVAHVTRVARSEGIVLGPGTVETIVRKARGDLRAAMNDLEAVAPLPPGPAQVAVLGVRDLTSDFEHLTEEALTAHRYFRSVEVQERLDAPPDDLLPWIEENIPHFSPDSVHRDAAFRVLAHADRFLRLARRQRVWSLWSYSSELLTGGVGMAIRDGAVPVREGAAFPQFLGEMGRSRWQRALRDGATVKAAHRFHLSREKVRLHVLPFLETVVRRGSEKGARSDLRSSSQALVRELDLTREEVGYLLGTEPESPLVDLLFEVPDPLRGSSHGRTEDDPSPGDTAMPSAPPGVARKVQRSLSEFGA
ncbi:MAG: AAA family ATPase [Thermoplasmata archaeon]|nr:AAA family ATPase [Thermoplasmata archaeon]